MGSRAFSLLSQSPASSSFSAHPQQFLRGAHPSLHSRFPLMAKRFAETRTNAKRKEPGGEKRPKRREKTEDDDIVQKIRRGHEASLSDPQLLLNYTGKTITEETASTKPPVYEDLLEALSSGRQRRLDSHKPRVGEREGASDTEDENSDFEDDTGEFEEDSSSEEDLPKSKSESAVERDDDEETSSDELSSSDQEEGGESDGEGSSESSSNDHFGVTLSDEDVSELMKKCWKFKWEMPMIDSASSKWVGTGESLSKDMDKIDHSGLLPKIYNHWLKEYKGFGSGNFHSLRQRQFFSLCHSYRDIMHCNKKPFYFKRSSHEDSDIMDAYIMHGVNHVFRSRNLVIKNDAKLMKDESSAKEELLTSNALCDQGFTRPKVLFLLPYRSFALRLVKRLIHLTPLSKKGKVEHLSRFLAEFGAADGKDDNCDDVIPDGDHDVGNMKSRKSTKPEDHEVLFGGNNDDCFLIGIKFTRKSIRLYGDFYSCDIIVASPLGLSKKIAETTSDKEKDVDYLSSIENWDHLMTVVEQLNHLPSKQHRTDVMRVRNWYTEGQARFYRQTILLSYFLNPDMNSLFNHHCLNYAGKVKTVCHQKGVLSKIPLPIKQVCERFNASSIEGIDDARFDYFVKKVYPKIKDSIQGGIMLFISSYLDFVRVRNFLKSQNASFCLLGEYTKQSDISRARVWFFQGTRKIMLYTERAHFYHRYKIRGIEHLYMYSLPERKDFYPEMLNMLGEAKSAACTVLFSRFDFLRLERIVGTAAAKRMVSSDKSMFVFS
ncbi:U3 small nucleolar RNA-associated protein isoform X2 [Wolffia australiana]